MRPLFCLAAVIGASLFSASDAFAQKVGGGVGGARPAARPFVRGVNPNFAGGFGVRQRAFVGGSRVGFPGFGYGGGLGYGGFLGNYGFGAGFGGGFGYGYGGENTLLYRLNYIPVPPYYSLHPPVYYGQRIFRSYGDSPYAESPRPRSYARLAPPIIPNPTISIAPVGAKKPGKDLTASYGNGQMIVNPFYDGAAADAETLVAKEGS